MDTQPETSIIVLTYNNLEHTRACLESVYANTSSFELIVVDNASQDGTPQFLQEFGRGRSNFRYMLNQNNEGFSRGNNQGAALAQGEYLVFLNNDTLVTPGWLPALLAHLGDPVVGMVGPVTNSAANQSRIRVEYPDLAEKPAFTEMRAYAHAYTQAHAGQAFEIEMLAFFCVGMRKSVFTEVGPLDEQFGVGMFEDEDYARRVRQAGYKILCAEDAFVHHHGSASFSRLGLSRYWYLFDQNRKKYEKKWGIRWQPQLYRAEEVRQQVSELVDQAAWHVSLVTELQGELNQSQQKNVVLEQTLQDIYQSKAWKLAAGLRGVRLALAPEGSWRERVLIKTWITFSKWVMVERDRITARQMSWYAYAFDRYKRARHAQVGSDLSDLRCPQQDRLISVVLPVFNGERYLVEAIDSVLQQTYENFELIIVDDGSTDRTPAIIASFAARDGRIRVITQVNQRLPNALNNGLGQARGEFLTWTSADNRMKPQFLEKMAACLCAHPEWEMVYANEDIIGEDGQPLQNSDWYLHYQKPPGSEHVHLPDDPSELNIYPNNYIGGAFLYRACVLYLLNGYSPWRFGAEDYDYWMRVNALLTLRHVDFDTPLYEYRFHAHSLTSQDAQLGITRKRVRLMTFDDYRRDLFLAPLMWKVEAAPLANQGGASVSQLVVAFRAGLEKRGQVVLPELPLRSEFQARQAANYPSVYLLVTDQPISGVAPPAEWDSASWKVLLLTDQRHISGAVDPGWNACYVIASDRNQGYLPRLPNGVSNDNRIAPRGWLAVPDIETLYRAMDIQARERYAAQYESLVEQPASLVYSELPFRTELPFRKISVVICTFRRGPLLNQAIHSVAVQDFPVTDYEVIIVNNDPADTGVATCVEAFQLNEFLGRSDRLKLVDCPIAGLSSARNAGIAAAQGQIISFLDDDAVAKPDWLSQTWLAFEKHPTAGVVGGAIRLRLPEPKPRWAKVGWEKFWSAFSPPASDGSPSGSPAGYIVINWWEFPWGANWSATRQALREIGGFRTFYGRRGADFGGGEELCAALAIQKLGYAIVVNPQAEVLHQPEFSRFTFQHVWRTIQSGKRIEYQLQKDLFLPMNLGFRWFIRNIARQLWKACGLNRLKWHQRLEHGLYAWAEAGQIWRYIMDRFHRFRTPFVMHSRQKCKV